IAPIVASVQTTAPATAAESPILQANVPTSAASDVSASVNALPAVGISDQTVVAPQIVASSQLISTGAPPERATWLGFEQSTFNAAAAEATLRIRVAQVNTPGTIAVHRVLGPWNAQSIASAALPPIDPAPVASYTVETDDAGLALETDVSSAV